MRVPYTLSSDSITVFVEGKVYTVLSGNKNFDALADHLKLRDHDPRTIIRLADKETHLRTQVEGTDVTIQNGVVFYKNEEVHNSLTDKLLDLLDQGYDVTPWCKFLNNLMNNPSYRSRTCLYEFLEKFNAPITPEGNFIAFKRVRSDWKDIHTATISNHIGAVIRMDRRNVDDDPNHTCSSGLHVCADEYLKNFASERHNRTLVVEVNPADVVAVPRDYNFSKMRVCEYKVLAEIEPAKMKSVYDTPVYKN